VNAISSRRGFLRGGLALGGAALWAPGAFAEHLLRTPSLTEGPFYPDKLPLDKDNDLIIVNNSLTPAIGEITNLTGRVLSATGAPLKDLTVEIWQCDANEVYLHSSDSGPKAAQRDKNFQGFGTFSTNEKGEYRFRTIKPVPYPGRPAPHIHFKVKKGDRELITTQMMIRGHAGNLRDGIFSEAGDLIDRELILVTFKPVKDAKVKQWTANFDIVLGRTPDERDLGQSRRGGR
jgi:protocatechuate 3,4-dioxygenase beta subunit